MTQLQLSALLSLICVAALAAAGYRPYVDECRGRVRQTLAAFLLIGILALAVFYPVTSFGEAEDIDPGVIWFPSLLLGHALLSVFLLLWWRLARAGTPLAEFLHLTSTDVWSKVRRGIFVGGAGWLLTVTVTGAVAGVMVSTGQVAEPHGAPPIMVWLAELPVMYKLVIVAAAMTVEEAFFRGFLQARVGLLLSTTMFTLSHFSYGLPFMIVGVFTISLIIGYTFARSGDLLPCIVAHGIFDGIQLLVILPWAVRTFGGAG